MHPKIAASLLALVLPLALLAGCDRPDPAPAAVAPDVDTLALVNGVPITRSDVFAYAGFEAAPGMPSPENVLEELINLELLRQQALAEGIDREEETRIILRNLETNLLASQVIERRTHAMRFSEAEVQAEYEAQIGAYGSTEFRARHILVDTEDAAAELIAALDGGADFAELAETHSTDDSGPDGGDLGWFTSGQMIPSFTDAVTALEPGTYTAQPVETRYGWHVILLEERRPIEAPPLASVRLQVEEILQARALRAYMDELRAGARIEFPIRPEQP
jgi:peptidyl-prolyl cis-trans isomerase C